MYNLITYYNIIFVILLLFILYYYYYIKKEETYAPKRERTDVQSDWNIVEKIRTIRARQDNNIKALSNQRNY